MSKGWLPVAPLPQVLRQHVGEAAAGDCPEPAGVLGAGLVVPLSLY